VRRQPRPLGALPAAICLVAAIGAAVAVFAQWRDGGVRLGWRPISEQAIATIRDCPDPLFNEMRDGGFLMWALANRRVFVDGRMEAYPLQVLRASRQADVYGDYETTFKQYGIKCAVVTARTLLYDKLSRDSSMTLISSDAGRAVFVRSGSDDGRQ
jgi:hypothetical protein